MKLFFTSIVLLAMAQAVPHRTIKLIAYPYIPDLQEDELAHLADFMQDRFFSDTGRRISILFDFTYATDTYTPSLVKAALGPSGGYDLQEIDTIILGYLLDHNVIQQIPSTVGFDGFTNQVLKMVSDTNGNRFASPSYTCTNIYYSYDTSLTGNTDFTSFSNWLNTPGRRHAGQLGWTGDLSSEPDLRLEYLDGWKDSHPDEHWVPNGYSPNLSQTDVTVVNNIKQLRDACTDHANHVNYCVDGTFYGNPDQWFDNFVAGGTVVLQGFPEYTSEILKRANADPMHPTRLHTASTAWVGDGDTPFIFTDAWVISRTNCDSDCQTTANIFLNWQRNNWAELISLGADLTPQRPRFLTVAYQPFYTSTDVYNLPRFARNYYHFFNQQVNRGDHLNTNKFWDNEDSQSATLESLITTGFTP